MQGACLQNIGFTSLSACYPVIKEPLMIWDYLPTKWLWGERSDVTMGLWIFRMIRGVLRF
jgi:hypothetical protein